MAIIALRRGKVLRMLNGGRMILFCAALLGGLSLSSAHADTKGGFYDPSGPGPTDPEPTRSADLFINGIRNEYIFVNVGDTGSFSTPTYNVPGRISVGNTGGSLRTAADDGTNLCSSDITGRTGAKPSSYLTDWPIYLQARVDGDNATRINVGFDNTKVVKHPTFYKLEDGYALVSEHQLTNVTGNNNTGGLFLRQTIRVRRSFARFEWVIINTDNQSHNVELRWSIHYRDANNFYYVDPIKGESDRTTRFVGTDVPSTFAIYNRRAEPAATAAPSSTPPFAARQILKQFDATAPTKMYVLDSDELQPGDTTVSGVFDPYFNATPSPQFNGIATATYFTVSAPGGLNANLGLLAAAKQGAVVTYFGNGGPTETPADDFVTAVEGPESLVYDTSAALDPKVIANAKSPSLATIGARFLTSDAATATAPTRFQIFASVYNQKPPATPSEVRFDGVSASLTLPTGLRFATDPNTNATDVSSKTIISSSGAGTVNSDQDGLVSWYVEATGERYGTLTYQVSVSIQDPSPLSRTVNRTINIPTPPIFSYKPGTFQMTGIPFQYDPLLSDGGFPATILNTNVSPVQTTTLTLFEYTGNVNPNRPYELATTLVPGRGYFFRPSIPSSGTSAERIIYLKGAKPVTSQAPSGGPAAPLRIKLKTGWNMVANPYVYEIPLSYLRFLQVPSLVKASYDTAVTSGLIRGGVYYYSTADKSYQFIQSIGDKLVPWQGYWIYANQDLDLEFANPTARGALVQPTPTSATNQEPEPATRHVNSDSNWRQQLVVRRDDGAQDSTIYVGAAAGVHALGTETRNMPKPPPIADYVYGGLVREGETTRYATVLQPLGGKQSWELEVVSDKDGSATLLWPNAAQLPRRVQLSLTDEQTGRTIRLRSAASLPITLRKEVVSRYRITAERSASQPLRITQLQTRSTRGGQAISVVLSREATITARILTQSGRQVQVLASSRAAGNGETLLSWNGRSQSGAPLPVGAYVVEIVATGTDGEAPVTLSRSISILR